MPEVGLGFIWGGGPIPDISLFSCHPSDYREVRPSASASRAGGRAAQVRAFTLPRGLPSAQIRVRGEGGAPAVDVQGPGGTRISVPLDGEQAENTTGNNFMAMRMDENTVEIGLRKPARGRWTVTPRQGSAPIGRVSVSQGSASTRVSGRVSGHGARRLLRYRIRNGEGQTVRFVEQGPRTHNQLGVARAGAGSIRFTPAPGGAGRRRILAYVEHDGVTVERIDVTRYAAPADAKPAKPRRLRVRRRKDAVLLRWRRVRGADGYAVVMQLSNRKRIFRVVKPAPADPARLPQAGAGPGVRAVAHNRRSIEPAGDRADQGRAGEASPSLRRRFSAGGRRLMRASSRIASERRGELAGVHELHRAAGARVAARGAGLVLAETPLGVGRPAAVERAVGAAKQVHEGGHRGS